MMELENATLDWQGLLADSSHLLRWYLYWNLSYLEYE